MGSTTRNSSLCSHPSARTDPVAQRHQAQLAGAASHPLHRGEQLATRPHRVNGHVPQILQRQVGERCHVHLTEPQQ